MVASYIMPVRTGRQYVEGLRKRPRDVWVNGERVEDVASYPAFRRPVESIAHLFDLQHDPSHSGVLTCLSAQKNERYATSFMIPHSYEDIVKRRKAFRLWAEATFGLMGRSPDFLNCTLAAFADAADVFGRGGAQYAENVLRFYEY